MTAITAVIAFGGFGALVLMTITPTANGGVVSPERGVFVDTRTVEAEHGQALSESIDDYRLSLPCDRQVQEHPVRLHTG
jgi:hypothetical protein